MAQRSNITQVLLHDNVSQQQILDEEISNLTSENQRITRMMDLQRKSFIVRQSIKQQQLRSLGITHLSFLPDSVVHDAIGYLRPAMSATHGKRGKSVSDDKGKSDNLSDNRAKSSIVIGNSRKDKSDNDKPKESLKMPLRSITVVNATNKTDKTTKLPQLTLGERSKTELPENLKTFSTYDFQKQPNIQETDNDGNEMKHAADDGDRSQTSVRKKSPLSFSMTSSTDSAKPKPKKTRIIKVDLNASDPRFENLERSLVRTCWPVGGYMQLSPCGSQLLRDCGQPLIDYNALHSTIERYNSLPSPRKSVKVEVEDPKNEENESELLKILTTKPKAAKDPEEVEYEDTVLI